MFADCLSCQSRHAVFPVGWWIAPLLALGLAGWVLLLYALFAFLG